MIVVSRDDHNCGDNVVVVPFTTQKLDKRRNLPSCVFFAAGESGLAHDCVAKTDEITSVAVMEFDWARGRIGRVLAPRMKDVVRAIRYMIRDDELVTISAHKAEEASNDSRLAAENRVSREPE